MPNSLDLTPSPLHEFNGATAKRLIKTARPCAPIGAWGQAEIGYDDDSFGVILARGHVWVRHY
jgi:hypothetical protein